MINKITLKSLSYLPAIIALAALVSISPAMAESVVVYGQVTLDGTPVNGVTISCNGNTTTTASSMYEGFYTLTLPIGKDYPITATYTDNGTTYTASDNIDLTGTTSGSTPIGLSALALKAQAAATPTPTPGPDATASPTPSPSANASVTPTPTPTATPTATPSRNIHWDAGPP